MKKYAALILLLSFGAAAQANEFKTTAGIGLQYGGVVGAQFSLLDEDTKYFVGAGLVGVSAGFKTVVGDSNKHSLGLNFGGNAVAADEGYIGANYDYYVNGFDQKGFVLGVSLNKAFGGKAEDNEFDGIRSGNIEALISIGYQF